MTTVPDAAPMAASPMPAELRQAAEAATGFMPPEEGLALYRAAAAYAPRGPVLEIGTYCGKSTIYLAAAARDAEQMVITVDHHHGSEENQPGWEYHDTTLVDERTGLLDTLRTSAPPSPRLDWNHTSSRWWAGLPRSPGCGGRRWGCCSSTAGTPTPRLPADYANWSPWVTQGGALAIHDVFPDQADGGQAPYTIYQRALSSGEFAEVSVHGSLRVLVRTASSPR